MKYFDIHGNELKEGDVFYSGDPMYVKTKQKKRVVVKDGILCNTWGNGRHIVRLNQDVLNICEAEKEREGVTEYPFYNGWSKI